MNQINVHPSHEPDVVESGSDRTAAAGINLITVLIVLAVVAVVLWYLFTGPLRIGGSSGPTTVNVNPAPTVNVNVNPPSQPNAPAPSQPNAPANNGGTGSSTGGTGSNSGGNPPSNNPPPANP